MRLRVLQLIAVIWFTCVPTARAETIVLEAAAYLDVLAGRLVTPAVIVIESDRIAEINPTTRPAGARTIRLPNITLLPGLMDAHTHLNYELIPGWETEAVRFTTGDFALRAVPNARKTLLAGFTTVRDLGTGLGFSDVALMHAIDKGWIDGPRVIPAAHAISITGGHCDITGFAPGAVPDAYLSGVADGTDGVLRAIRHQVKHGAKVIKICATAGVLSFEGPLGAQQFSAEELQAAATEAHRHGLKIAAHAHGAEGIIAASEAGIDSIEHGTILTDEAARVLKKNGTFIVPNLYLDEAMDMDTLPPPIAAKAKKLAPIAQESFTRTLDYGLKIAFGTDAGVFPHGDNAKELTIQVKHGRPPIEAIRSATIVNAELLDTPDRGRIEPGLLADVIGVEGDPLVDISCLERVTFVMKGGTIYKGGH